MLSRLAGKVVAMNFIYTRCPLPDYCFRLSNHLASLQKRFAERMGRDLILMTGTFDPAHDRPDVMANYARIWQANPLIVELRGKSCCRPCGDANGDMAVNISDAVYLIAYIFAGGSPPSPMLAGDANCNGAVNISDAVYLIAYIFSGGAAPCAAC